MHLLTPDNHSRRSFLRRSAQLALSGTALPMALNLPPSAKPLPLTPPTTKPWSACSCTVPTTTPTPW